MRLIDSKGRLFGIINLLDLLVVLVVLVLISSVLLNVTHRSKVSTGSSAQVLVKVFVRVPSDVARSAKVLRPGDILLGGNAVVEKVLEVKPAVNDGAYSDMVILLKANCVILNKEYYCANAPIKINSPINIGNPDYIFNNATIVDVEKKAK